MQRYYVRVPIKLYDIEPKLQEPVPNISRGPSVWTPPPLPPLPFVDTQTDRQDALRYLPFLNGYGMTGMQPDPRPPPNIGAEDGMSKVPVGFDSRWQVDADKPADTSPPGAPFSLKR